MSQHVQFSGTYPYDRNEPMAFPKMIHYMQNNGIHHYDNEPMAFEVLSHRAELIYLIQRA
jgi:hypothetical protein